MWRPLRKVGGPGRIFHAFGRAKHWSRFPLPALEGPSSLGAVNLPRATTVHQP
jgi:hypothetical protein